MRVGLGYDVHKLTDGRKFILGGVEIPFEKGLLGHSDADVLVHAIMDSLLGAAALGDIGQHFPDTDEQYEGADSLVLLKEVKNLLDQKCYIIGNLDAVVIAQRPKLSPYMNDMKQNIADTLQISSNQINIKATTEEGLGFTGAGEGVACQVICMLQSIENYAYDEGKTVYAFQPDSGNSIEEGSRDCSACEGCCKKLV